jgi:hypothetical protein
VLIRSQNLAAYIRARSSLAVCSVVRASLAQWLGQYHHVVGLHLTVAALQGHRCAADGITSAEYPYRRQVNGSERV